MANIIFLGPPGAGKGTIAQEISTFYNWPHISTGDIFRKAYQEKTSLGIQAHDAYWGKGILVPDDLTNELAFARLQQQDCAAGFILDGYPRTIGQATAFERFSISSNSNNCIDVVIYFSCNEDTLVDRLTSRSVCRQCGAIYGKNIPSAKEGRCDKCAGELYQRQDDQEMVVRERFKEYLLKTAPLLEFYEQRGLVQKIDAAQRVERVVDDVKSVVSKGMRQ